jgi:SAM-dependent methyltransferase
VQSQCFIVADAFIVASLLRSAMSQGPLNPLRALALPSLYRLLGTTFGRTRQWKIFARDYVGAQPGNRILDVGCGPADVLTELPADIDYIGFDQSEHYIDSARQRYGARGQFFTGKVDLAHIERLGAASFDIVIAHGLLHHLDDSQATEFFALARAALRPGGRLITADGCYLAGQSRIARLLLDLDRGNHVRTEPEYVALAAQSFTNPCAFVRHDSAYVPYTTVYLDCQA